MKHGKDMLFFIFTPAAITFLGLLFFRLACFGNNCSRDVYFIPLMFGVGAVFYRGYKYSHKDIKPLHWLITALLAFISGSLIVLTTGIIPQ